MFTTTLAAAVLATSAYLPGPAWTADYNTAAKQAVEQGKPIAVFIAGGSEGYAQVVANGTLPAEAARTLKDKYVCVFVDTTTEAGKATAAAFELKEGFVLSTVGGKHQAVRHAGAVAPAELSKELARCVEVTTVATTATNEAPAVVAPAPVVRSSHYTPSFSYGSCPSCRGSR